MGIYCKIILWKFIQESTIKLEPNLIEAYCLFAPKLATIRPLFISIAKGIFMFIRKYTIAGLRMIH